MFYLNMNLQNSIPFKVPKIGQYFSSRSFVADNLKIAYSV